MGFWGLREADISSGHEVWGDIHNVHRAWGMGNGGQEKRMQETEG